jgi:hypothetical protein
MIAGATHAAIILAPYLRFFAHCFLVLVIPFFTKEKLFEQLIGVIYSAN